MDQAKIDSVLASLIKVRDPHAPHFPANMPAEAVARITAKLAEAKTRQEARIQARLQANPVLAARLQARPAHTRPTMLAPVSRHALQTAIKEIGAEVAKDSSIAIPQRKAKVSEIIINAIPTTVAAPMKARLQHLVTMEVNHAIVA